jgi:hypothetical protein
MIYEVILSVTGLPAKLTENEKNERELLVCHHAPAYRIF